MSKSYWTSVFVDTNHTNDSVKSWFLPPCDGMTLYKAEILCDIATDREKKIRAFMTDADGKRYQFVRTRGGRTFSISMKCISSPPTLERERGQR